MPLSDKAAVVTGGGRGIGRATALALAQAGARVTVAARTLSEIESLAAELEGAGHWVYQELPEAFEITVQWFLQNARR